jgi:hypothetical protein
MASILKVYEQSSIQELAARGWSRRRIARTLKLDRRWIDRHGRRQDLLPGSRCPRRGAAPPGAQAVVAGQGAGSHLVRYYGWYSNKTRGRRAQRRPAAAAAGTGIPARSPTAREARKGWAALIKQVGEGKAAHTEGQSRGGFQRCDESIHNS